MPPIAAALPIIALVWGAIAAPPALAVEMLPIRPGMSFDDIMGRLKPVCLRLQAGGTEGKTVTCYLTEGSPPPMITATISKKDRAWYVGWWTPIPGPDPIGVAGTMAPKLGFTGERTLCDRNQKQMPCWKAADGTVLYAAGRDERSGLFAFYLHNQTIEKADAR